MTYSSNTRRRTAGTGTNSKAARDRAKARRAVLTRIDDARDRLEAQRLKIAQLRTELKAIT